METASLEFADQISYIPGHMHAYYIIFVYYHRRSQRRKGLPLGPDAIVIFSKKVQDGGYINHRHWYPYVQ